MRDKPLLSQVGNPYPEGLEPAHIDMTPPHGIAPERGWPRPLPDPFPACDFGSNKGTRQYLHGTFGPHEPRPFKLRLAPRRPGETDAQYEVYQRNIERHYHAHLTYHMLCRALCTLLGNHRRCRRRACRRTRCCRGRRDEDRFAVSLLIYPPCVPLDLEIIETYRAEIVAELRLSVADAVQR